MAVIRFSVDAARSEARKLADAGSALADVGRLHIDLPPPLGLLADVLAELDAAAGQVAAAVGEAAVQAAAHVAAVADAAVQADGSVRSPG